MGWGFFKRHSLFTAVVIFLLITLPGTIDSYWDLWQKYAEANMPPLDFGFWFRVLLPVVGFIIAGIILWQLRGNKTIVSTTAPTSLLDNKSIISEKPIKKAPNRLEHDNVLWEDGGTYVGGGIVVDGPLCPKDYAVLMMERFDKIEQLEYNELISSDIHHHRLYCPECKSKYTLDDNPKSASDSSAEVRSRFEGMRRRNQTV